MDAQMRAWPGLAWLTASNERTNTYHHHHHSIFTHSLWFTAWTETSISGYIGYPLANCHVKLRESTRLRERVSEQAKEHL